MLVRLDRITLSPEQLAVPIPSFSNRQFIVAKYKKSVSQETFIREMFWYRQELLKSIQATWNEVSDISFMRCDLIHLANLIHSRLEVNDRDRFL